jgi:transcriptional regulator with XRE-family HTH domain
LDVPIPAQVWQSLAMSTALAAHDLATAFRRLHRLGLSQRAIAARTGLSGSQVSQVMRGEPVQAYAVLVRIAQGLNIPRGMMGLAFTTTTTTTAVDAQAGRVWTRTRVRALRVALRQSQRAFAARLGVSARAVCNWEAGHAIPGLANQGVLDTCLALAGADAQHRFATSTTVGQQR